MSFFDEIFQFHLDGFYRLVFEGGIDMLWYMFISSSRVADRESSIGVSVTPGLSTLTRMPRSLNSAAQVRA